MAHDSSKDFKFPLKVYVNKEKNKVVYAVGDHRFADILLSFITLPLGRIVKVLEKHYVDDDKVKATIGSLNSLHRSLANLPTSLFWDAQAKRALLEQRSSFEDEYEGLTLDVSDSPPASQYFFCTCCANTFRSVSIYYTELKYCRFCKRNTITKFTKLAERIGFGGCAAFLSHKASFVISDDLQILPNETGLFRIITVVGISNIDDLHEIKVDLGFNEIMNLLKACMTSATPLSDVILNETAQMKHSATVESQLKIVKKEENPSSNTDKHLSLKLMIQKSTGKFLYAEAKEKFIEFLFSLLIIPAGRAENLVAAAAAGKASLKGINNLYRSTCEFIDDEYFRTPDMKNRLMKLNLPHGYISKDRMILPLSEECLPDHYTDQRLSSFSSTVFPKGQGSYLEGPRTYQVMDDLTVTPFCFVSILSSLREQEIQLSDVKEVELQIGLKEALCILKASLTSTSAITDALLSRIPNKIPKREV